MKTTLSYSILSIFYLAILFSTIFLLTSCELNNERVGGFPPEGQIWAEIENLEYTFPEPSGTIPSLLNTYSVSVKSLSIYRTTNFNSTRTGNFRVLLTSFDFDDTTPRNLDNLNVRLEFSQGNLAYIGTGDDIQFEILSIENDVIKANFSGTLKNRDNPNQQIRVRNGALHIRIRRE
ncbi:MAG: hypothetical protein COZ18_09270 [Flexibacter sp. CG_4_10_14_3_um_filter_32_15]|nr:MAG: hypothetical protein COZ18_09270 [Flexibacter sp. CG_4_10_14_3_um_filter_32_15]